MAEMLHQKKTGEQIVLLDRTIDSVAKIPNEGPTDHFGLFLRFL